MGTLSPGGSKQVKCKYCLAIMFGAISILKHHKVRIQWEDVVCDGFPAEVIAQMQVSFDSIIKQIQGEMGWG